ncbi:MAG TPA: BamA/TamA family outer membrane protein [Longimicrobiales bacterium]
MTRLFLLSLVFLVLLPAPLRAQDDAYLDPTARELVARSREARGRLGSELESYEVVVLQRMAARLRVPLRDRLLGRQESAVRIRWTRGGRPIVQMIGGRSEGLGEPATVPTPDLDAMFDPDADRFNFGIDIALGLTRDSADADSTANDSTSASLRIGTDGIDAELEGGEDAEDFWIAHPLADGSERFYRYRSGDTLTLRLPSGRAVRMVELSAIPRAASFHHLRASLWIEPESGSLVRAIFRPARDLDVQRDTAFVDAEDVDDMRIIPGVFKPIVIDFELITIEYSLWDQRHWLPYRRTMSGSVRAGVLRVPFEGETSYRFEEVNDVNLPGPQSPDDVLARWVDDARAVTVDSMEFDGQWVTVVMSHDTAALLASDELPPPIWEDSPDFASSSEMEDLARRLFEGVPGVTQTARPTFDVQYLLGGRGLIRYNRVEALSLGVRGVVDHPLARAHATVRLGAADLHPNVELGVLHARREVAWRAEAYHRLTTTEPLLPGFEAPQPALGFGNSLNALLFGRDDGFYYRTTGATLALEPAPQERPSWRIAGFVEQHDAARRKVEWNVASWLDDDRRFEPNLPADDILVAGGSVVLSPWFGVGTGPQAGLELFGEGAGGDSTFARARVTGRTILPLFAGLRLGAEAAAGSAWGGLPTQYHWFLGGVETLRGYDIGDAAGASMARARAELTRGSLIAGLALFADAGWAGPSLGDFDTDDALLSAGLGVTLLDGLVRVDVARALAAPTGWRLHLHLNALL